ncbi:MAG: hypothetical protein V3T08_08040 [Gemmatimonadota bacterium]
MKHSDKVGESGGTLGRWGRIARRLYIGLVALLCVATVSLWSSSSGVERAVAIGVTAALLSPFLLRPSTRRVVQVNLVIACALMGIAELFFGGRDAIRRIAPIARHRAVVDQRTSSAGASAVVFPAVHPQQFLDIQDLSCGVPLRLVSVEGRSYLPLAGIADVKTVYCRGDDGWLVFTSDGRGFNNPSSAQDGADLVVVGDSFAQGACVPTGASFVDLLRKERSAVYTIGQGGAGPLTELALLREYLPALRPKTVLWVYFAGNDVMRNDSARPSDLDIELRSAILRRYLEEPSFKQDLERLHGAIDRELRRQVEGRLRRAGVASWKWWQGIADLATFRALTRHVRTHAAYIARRKAKDVSFYRRERLPVFERTLVAARESARQNAAELLFVYLPAKALPPLRDDVLAIVRRLKLELIDLYPLAKAHTGTAMWSARGGHFSQAGNQRVHAAISAALAEHAAGSGG